MGHSLINYRLLFSQAVASKAAHCLMPQIRVGLRVALWTLSLDRWLGDRGFLAPSSLRVGGILQVPFLGFLVQNKQILTFL